MDIHPARLDGMLVLEPSVRGDERGFFVETFRASSLAEHGVDVAFVQDNHSRSRRGTLRGMHFQTGRGQAKLVRVARGRIVDVGVDIRRSSRTFGEWEAIELDDESARQVFLPGGFAHGFCVLSDVADVVYKCSSYYDAASEDGFAYDDPEVAIDWPALAELTVSARDRGAPRLAEIADRLPA